MFTVYFKYFLVRKDQQKRWIFLDPERLFFFVPFFALLVFIIQITSLWLVVSQAGVVLEDFLCRIYTWTGLSVTVT